MIKTKSSLEILHELISKYNFPDFLSLGVIPWACPIMSFGDIKKSKIATLGINPSNKEFVSTNDTELQGEIRRFETLNSLNLKSWQDINSQQLESVLTAFDMYFANNPYNKWFRPLDSLISGSRYSYYFPYNNACHLDLVPFATFEKWGNIPNHQRRCLLNMSVDSLGDILNASSIRKLILNGQSVVEGLKNCTDLDLQTQYLPDLDLKRAQKTPVKGIVYKGIVTRIGNVKLKSSIDILGYNHNLQSSYGVTKNVVNHLQSWITNEL